MPDTESSTYTEKTLKDVFSPERFFTPFPPHPSRSCGTPLVY